MMKRKLVWVHETCGTNVLYVNVLAVASYFNDNGVRKARCIISAIRMVDVPLADLLTLPR